MTDGGKKLRVAARADGVDLWPTKAEAALARVRELEALLAQRSG